MTATPSAFAVIEGGGVGLGLPIRQIGESYQFTGVSYIRVPKSLPPDGASSPWLAAEGLLGLVWCGGK